MPEVTITAEDVRRLGAKLDALGERLDEREHAVLLAVFGLAAEAWAGREEAEVAGYDLGTGLVLQWSGPLPSPSDGLLPFGDSSTARDVSSGMATGRRQWAPVTIRRP